MTVGIDLGTTFSAISWVNATGAPALCPDRLDPNRFHTPSVVHIGPRGCFVGEMAEQVFSEDPSIAICRFAKASMGQAGPVFVDHQQRNWNAESISALVLRKLKLDAEMASVPIERCVISVPAHFNEAEKRATANAARLAELPLVGLVEEPVAAATFSVAAQQARDMTVFVFDLGGGTLDATILHSSPEGLYVLATEGAPNLGGRNFDEVIMKLCLEQFHAQFGHDPSTDASAMQSLRVFATKAKLDLSQPRGTALNRAVMIAGQGLRVTLSRPQFEAASTPLTGACLTVCQRVLRSAALSWSQIDELILVGGGSLLPCVEKAIVEASGFPPERIRRQHPHAAVAYGAALLAEQQFGSRETISPPLRQSVTTNQLGLRMIDPATRQPYFHVLIERNVPLPASHTMEIYTANDEQSVIALEVLQRKSPDEAPEHLGRLRFGPLPHTGRNYPVRASLSYDETGRVHISASDGRTGEAVQQLIAGQEEADLTAAFEQIQTLSIYA